MQLGADVNEELHNCHDVRRVLMHSDEQGDDKGLRLLIELGGNVNIKHGCMELTPLEAALQQGQDECVQILLEFGADSNWKSFSRGCVK